MRPRKDKARSPGPMKVSIYDYLYSDSLKPAFIAPVNLSDASKYLRRHPDIFLSNLENISFKS